MTDQRISITGAQRAAFNMGVLLIQAAARHPDRAGFIAGDARASFADLDACAGAFGAALLAMGCRPGDRVLVQGRNSRALFESAWAIWRIGAIWAPVNARLSPDEVAFAAAHSGSRFMLCDPDFQRHADAAKAACPDLRIIWTEPGGTEGATYQDLVEAHRGAPCAVAEVGDGDPCWMFFTSGTTGRPKAALLGHAHMAAVITTFIADVLTGIEDGEAFLALAPLSHGAGVQMVANVAKAATTVITSSPRLDPEEVWQLVAQHRISNIFTVPTILKALVEHAAVDRYNRASLRTITYSGSPMYRADQKRALHKLGQVIVQLYGLAEVTAGITVLPAKLHSEDDLPYMESCGFPRTGMEIGILDDDGHPVQTGEIGTVCARGQNVFLGYHNDPVANAKAFRNGWFWTGDLGRLDARGFLYLTGRTSDMFISGGNNIYPLEVEQALLEHPGISEAAVFGIPDPFWGEIGVAIIVPHPQQAIDESALPELLEHRLAKYKWPRQFRVWSELPKSGYGKVPKELVRRAYLQREQCKS